MTGALAAPPFIHYQGLALNTSGAPISTAVDVTFSLFDLETDGNLVWTETHPAVQPVDGVFAVLLGSIEPFTATTFAQDERWLEIEIAGETLAPRQRLASAPWALRAGCTPGDMLTCYTGDIETLDEGICVAGRRTCDTTGAWGACTGEVVPVAEVCDDGLDNDCNGSIDDGCPVCGNGVLEDGEACDDGNLVDGDGCSATCTVEDPAQVAPADARFNDPLDIPLDNTTSVLDFVSYPNGDTEDRVRYQVLGMNANPSLSGGQARLTIAVSCFGDNIDQIQVFAGGTTFSCGETIVDQTVTADSDTGSVTITAVGGVGTYVQWVLTGTATRVN